MFAGSVLTLLEFEESDLKQRVSTEARPSYTEINLTPQTHHLSPEDRVRLTLFMRECRLDCLLYHSGTQFQPFTPPTGYAATFHEDTTFQPSLFEHPFRILATCSVDKKGRLSDEEIARWKRVLNATIPDKSPRPPLYSKRTAVKSGDWSPSLGCMSWIGFGDQNHSVGGLGLRCVYVICGLDPQTIDDLQQEFYRLAKNHSFKEAKPVLDWARDIVRENARRLLYMAITSMGLVSKAEVHDGGSLYPAQRILPWQLEWLEECGVDKVTDVPACIQFPPEPPNECPLYPTCGDDSEDDSSEDEEEDEDGPYFDPYPRSIVPEIEIMIDDIVSYPHVKDHLVRLSNACALQGKVARILGGPDGDIQVADALPVEETAKWLHAFPSQGRLSVIPNADTRFEDWTTLDPVAGSQYLSIFTFDLPDVGMDGTKPGVTTIRPVLVRVTSVLPSFATLLDCHKF